MSETENYFEAVLCNLNGVNGYMLRQYVNGVLRVEQFVSDLSAWCKASGVPLKTIAVIDQGVIYAPFSPFTLLWLRVRSFCGIMKYNTVLRYGCARVLSAGVFALPYFSDLIKAVLSVFYCVPYVDYTHEKKSP